MRKSKAGHPFEVIFLNIHHEKCRTAILQTGRDMGVCTPGDFSPQLCPNCWELMLRGLDAQQAIGRRIKISIKTLERIDTFYIKCREAYAAAMKKKSWDQAKKSVCEALHISEPSFHFDSDWFRPILSASCQLSSKRVKPFEKAFRPYRWSPALLLQKRIVPKKSDPVRNWQRYTRANETSYK